MKFSTFIVTCVVVLSPCCNGQGPFEAVVVLNVGNVGRTTGFLQLHQASVDDAVTITGEITGLEPNSIHGFHVHNSGDVTKGCGSTGGHFNPRKVTHGGPNDQTRHVGDLGNIQADASGTAHVEISDNVISLCGPNSIIGRAFVLHSSVDDLGKGGVADSLQTGNAGSRIACGIIGLL